VILIQKYISKRTLLILGFFFFISTKFELKAQNYFKVTPGIELAYKNISDLKIQRAQDILDSLKIVESQNMLVYHIENYIDFYKIFIHEDYNEFIRLEKNKEYRLNKIDSGDEDSPYFRFSKAEIYLQWALVRLKFEENFTAVSEIKSAYKLLRKNEKKFPNFIENYKSLSVIRALIGTLPDFYKGLLTFFTGIKGTIKQGANEIARVVEYSENNKFLFKDEAYTISSFISFHLENNRQKSWQTISSGNLDIKNSPLACFVMANIAQKTGRNNEAIKILMNRPKGDERLDFHYLDYMLGRSLLYKNDLRAIGSLNSFVNNFKGINYIKDAYLKLAWFELIVNKDEKQYRINIEKCISRGKSVVDEDKTAYKAALKTEIPNPILLKARLLFDGSYFLKAYTYLIQHEKDLLYSPDLSLEFNYRMGRILQSLESYTDAINYFEKAIELGKDEKSHYACIAALQNGVIFEKLKKYKSAKNYYKLCLSIDPDEYKNSTHQNAKAGLLRISK